MTYSAFCRKLCLGRCLRQSRQALLGCLRALGAVLGASLLAVLDALGVERAANNVVANTRKILYTTAADEHHGVFLEVVAFAANVRNDFEAIATLRRAEFGFFGVVAYTRVQTPRFCGQFLRAGLLLLSCVSSRGLRTSWLIVGISSV